jgi:hypothetical protein
MEDRMSKEQRIVLSFGVLLVVLSWLFPPYEGQYYSGGEKYTIYLGYHFISPLLNQKWSANTFPQISSIRVSLQLVTIVLATLGLFFAVKKND